MRKSAALVVMILLLTSLPILYTTPNTAPNQTTVTKPTEPITAYRAGWPNYTIPLLINQNFSGTAGSGGTDYWNYEEWGTNPEAADGYLTTSTYVSPPAAVTLRLQYTSRDCELGWTQPFTYTGTRNITYAWLTFSYRVTSFTSAGSTNYVMIYMELPKYSGNWVMIWHEHFYGTTSWRYRTLNITQYLWQYGANTYQFEADAHLSTGSSGTPMVVVRYDDVGIGVNYQTPTTPSGLTVKINNDATYTNNTRVTLSLTASGADKMFFSNSSTLPPSPNWENFSTTKQVSLTTGDGTKNIYYWAKNVVGVTGPFSDSITYDGTPPNTPSLTSPANGTAMKNNAPTFTWTAVTDPVVGDVASGLASYTLEYSTSKTFPGGATTPIYGLTGASYTPSGLADGTWYWHVRAVDNAGNVGSWSSPYRVIIVDTVYPSPPLLSLPASGTFTNNKNPTFTWNNASDSSPTSGIANHTLQYSKDPNFSSGVTEVKINMPTLSYIVPGGGLSDGTWYWRVRATDKAGNVGSYSSYWSIVVDTVVPHQPTLLSPSGGTETGDNTPLLVWSAASDDAPSSGIANYTLQLDTSSSFGSVNLTTISGLTVTSFTVPDGDPLSDGTWYWHVMAIDKAGNQGSYSSYLNFLVDTTGPPTPNLISPSDGGTTGDNTPDMKWRKVTDAGSGVASYTLQLDTSPTFDTTANLTTILGLTVNYTLTTPLGDDVWYWRVKAVDDVGNAGSWSTYWNLTIDTKVPGAPTLISPANGYIASISTQSFSWTLVGANSYDLYVDNDPDFTSPLSFIGLTNNSKVVGGLGEGNWYWKVIAQRPGGSNSSTVWAVLIDTVKPGAPVLSNPNNSTHLNDSTPTFTWNSATDATSGVANYTLQLDTSSSFGSVNLRTISGLTVTSFTVPDGDPLSDGTWYWHVMAIDKAGNQGSYSSKWNMTVDTVAPSGLSLSVAGGGYTNTLAINLNIGATGANKMYLSNDGSIWTEYLFDITKGWTLTAGDGSKTIYFKCSDTAGNIAGPISTTATLDTVPPTAGSPLSPAVGTFTNNNKTTFQFSSGSDVAGSGVASYALQLDTSPNFNTANKTTITGLTGNYTLTTPLGDDTWYWRVNATDNAGNRGYYSTYSWFTILTIPPGKCPGLKPYNGTSINTASPPLNWTRVSGGERYHIQIDKSPSFNTPNLIENETVTRSATEARGGTDPSRAEFSPVDNNMVLTEGTWYWRVEAIDKAGNHGGYSTALTLIVDVTPPKSPSLLSPADSTATKTRSKLSFSWSPAPGEVNASYWFWLDLTSYFNSSDLNFYTGLQKTSCIINKSLPDGIWYWRVFALDSAGNINNSISVPTYEVMIDTVGPGSPNPKSPQQGYLTKDTTLTLLWDQASDFRVTTPYGDVFSGIANYTLWLDNSTLFDSPNLKIVPGLTRTNYTTPVLSDDTWYWSVFAFDNAGNLGSTSPVRGFIVDTIGPDPPMMSSMLPNAESGRPPENVSKPTFLWGSSSDRNGIDHYVIEIDTSKTFDSPSIHSYTVVGLTHTPDVELDNGQWYWRIAAVDSAGNVGAWSAPVLFVVNVVGGLSPMMIIIAGGGSSGAVILAVLGYILYRRAKIPFVIKKIDQSIKLIGKGEMPPPVPMRSRAEIIETIFQGKVAILSKEKIEELEPKKQKKRKKEPEKPEEPSEKEAEVKPKRAKPPAAGETEEADVDMIVKELEKLETKEEMESSKESDFIKREMEELEKTKKKRKE